MSPSSTGSREGSRDRSESRMIKHQHSWSESGRSSVPMWDSSDPDRAPPPLPLNPGANSPITKPHTSANIEKAAALIASRALENAPSAYTSNPPPISLSPDKNIIKPQHRRMQSIQTGGVNRISDSLERRSPDKSLRTPKLSDYEDFRSSRSPERSPTRLGSETPTPSAKISIPKLTDENTPLSSSMLALQAVRNRQEFESPLGDITNGASQAASTLSFDALSTQILNITNIATNLQKEMTSLSRRSKDNASDLLSLREATSTRDEDIRKSLRDLLQGLDHKFGSIDSKLLSAPEASRSTPNLSLYLDDKEHGTPTRKGYVLPRIASPASFLERDITSSPSVLSVDGAASIAMLEKVLREMATKDGQEKVMNTLEMVKAQAGESRSVVSTSKPAIDPNMMQKLEEILVFMKDMRADSGSRALIKAGPGESGPSPSQLDVYLDNNLKGNTARHPQNVNHNSTDAMSEEVVKTLKSVKQSLSQNGGLTNEVKALVRELRGEVLGMGREIARRLDEAGSVDKDKELSPETNGENVAQVVEQGLAELKEHMHHVIQTNQRQLSIPDRSVDTTEVVLAVKNVLQEMPRPRDDSNRDPIAEREELMIAIKEAWEDCKPEIALEHFGLERDEILETLKEGLQSYRPQEAPQHDLDAIYGRVLEAVQQGLADHQPAQIKTESGPTTEEITAAVHEVLESFQFPVVNGSAISNDSTLTRDEVGSALREVLSSHSITTSHGGLTRDDILDTVRDSVSAQPPMTKEIEFNRDDLFDAIKACLEGEQNPLGGMGERVVEAMHEFLSSMKTEFQQYSAASGRDTEQVLDAMKDGLEDLRAEIESYVDRAADVTGKDEIIDTVKAGFAAMQVDMDKGFSARNAQAPQTSELLDAMDKEFEHLRDTLRRSLSDANVSSDRNEIIDAIRDLADERQSSLSTNSEDIARLVKEELEHMRSVLSDNLMRHGSAINRDDVLDAVREGLETSRSMPRGDGNESILSNTSELLDAFQDGVDGIRADMQKLMDRPADLSTSYEILDTLKAGIDDIRVELGHLKSKHDDLLDVDGSKGREVMLHDENGITAQIESLKVMITQLRIKVEALDHTPVSEAIIPTEMRVHRDDMDTIHAALDGHAQKEDMDFLHAAIQQVQQSVDSVPREMPEIHIPEISLPTNIASKDDTNAIETLLRNVKAKLDTIEVPDINALAKGLNTDHLERLLAEVKASVEESAARSTEPTNREDFTIMELLLKEIAGSVEGLQSRPRDFGNDDEKLSKTDLEVLESVCMDVKTLLDDMKLPDVAQIATKDDIGDLRDNFKAFREQFDADNDLTAQAFEARKIEHGGLANKIDDVRSLMADVRDELIGKLNGSEEGIVELNTVLGMHHDSMSKYASAASVAELTDLVGKALDVHVEHLSTSKVEMGERDATLFSKHDETSAELKAKIQEKFDELMTKYDDAQIANKGKLDAFENRDKEHLALFNDFKVTIEELKSLTSTLGSTVTETCEKMTDDSKTVFDVVDQSNIKIGDLHAANAHEHGLTREEVAKTLDAAIRLEGSLQNHQPAILAAIREVLEKVGQHFQHSQQQSETFTRATEEIKTGVNAIPSAIPPLLPALPPIEPVTIPVVETITQPEYDDSQVHLKLDDLLSHTALAKEAFATMDSHHVNTSERLASLDKLDSIHERVRATAEEITAMVATQTRLMNEHHESQAEEARQAAVALEKRTAQKEKVESDIVFLNDEKNALIESMAALKREHMELSGQTKHLTREVAKLETALSIRQEEMREMNQRAESLERRILEGVMNHARSLKISKPIPKKKISPAERDASMSLKRVPSTSSNTTARTSVKAPSSIGSTMGMALKKRSPLGAASGGNGTRVSAVDRRILSTSHVTGNRPSDVNRSLVLAPVPNTGLVNLKRSHSVKSNPGNYLSGRKQSWSGMEPTLADKENHIDDGDRDVEHDEEDSSSDTSTERRTSLSGTSYMYTDSSVSRNSRRSTSYASSLNGTINGHGPESILEEDEEDEDDEIDGQHDDELSANEDDNAGTLTLVQTGPQAIDAHKNDSQSLALVEGFEAIDSVGELPAHSELHRHHQPKYAAPSDSGIGSEPPTPDTSTQGWRSSVST